jgi:hypothetical protein
LPEAEEWIRAQVDATGERELVHERPWATVWRVPLRSGAAWFKACGPVQAFEPRLTAALASRRPDLLPDVVGHDDERAWLLLRDAGEPIGLRAGPAPWLTVLPRYAELQRAEAAHAQEHLDAGVPDRRLAVFPALYDAMVARDLPLSSADRAWLRTFRTQFTELCAELEAHDVPETMQHDDLHGMNVYGREGARRILDWGDACVSHPFLTMFVTFLHIDDLTGPWRDRLRDAYLWPWGGASALRATFELAQRLGVFAHVFKELHVLDVIPGDERQAFERKIAALLSQGVKASRAQA